MTRLHIEEFLRVKGTPYATRMSDLLVEQLRMGIYDDRVHSHRVIDEIRHLEGSGGSSTKPAELFNGDVLKGFWHKHFTQSNFIAQNLMVGMKMDDPNSQKFENLVRSLQKKHKDHQQFAAHLAHEFTVSNYEERARKGKLTGEWLVFSKHNGQNYYLTLASHREEDLAIRDRIQGYCSQQFPFLFI